MAVVIGVEVCAKMAKYKAVCVCARRRKLSKQSHDGFGTKARKNMQIVAPAMFADKIEWRCRNIEGKKIVCGCGEKGTSKTCTKCGFWQPDLGGKKEYKCKNGDCGLKINRRKSKKSKI